jgi:hypothetical protein
MMLHSPAMTKRCCPLVPLFRDESVVDGKLCSSASSPTCGSVKPHACERRKWRPRRNGLREEAIDLLREGHGVEVSG